MNGFAQDDNALPVREQHFNAFKSRRAKISQMISSGRLGSPLSYVIVARGVAGGGGGGGGGGDGGLMVTGVAWPNSRSIPEVFPIRSISPKECAVL